MRMSNSAITIVKRSGFGLSQRKRILNVVISLFFLLYSIVTVFPFYILFVRTFVGTKDATTLHLWIPPVEPISMDAELGNLSIFFNLDLKKVKQDFGIPASAYLPARMTLRQMAEKFNIPPEKVQKYFNPFLRFNGWIVLFTGGKIWPALARTLLVTVGSIVGVNILAILTGYGLAGLRRRDQMLVYNLYLLQMVIPSMLVIIPQFVIMQWFVGLFPNSGSPGFTRYVAQILGLLLINIKGGALSTMVFTSFISAIPRDLEECAEIDGAGRLQYLVNVLLPLLKVPIASLTVIMLPGFWNQFLEPYVYLDPPNTTFIPLIQNYSGQYTTNFQVVYTAVFVSVLPLLVVYVFARRWFIRGLLAGALKG